MLEQFTYHQIFGIPLIAYGGIITLGFLMATAYSGSKSMPIKTHKTLAAITATLAIFHGLLAILAYF